MSVNIRAARLASGKTQAEVAKEAGITERGYQDFEARNEYRAVQTAICIAKALGINDFEKFKKLFGTATPTTEKEPDGNPT